MAGNHQHQQISLTAGRSGLADSPRRGPTNGHRAAWRWLIGVHSCTCGGGAQPCRPTRTPGPPERMGDFPGRRGASPRAAFFMSWRPASTRASLPAPRFLLAIEPQADPPSELAGREPDRRRRLVFCCLGGCSRVRHGDETEPDPVGLLMATGPAVGMVRARMPARH